MDKVQYENMEKETNRIWSALKSAAPGSEEYKNLQSALKSYQEIDIKDQEAESSRLESNMKREEIDRRLTIDESKLELESEKVKLDERKLTVSAVENEAKIKQSDRDGRRQMAKAGLSLVGTTALVMLTAHYEEVKILPQKTWGWITKFLKL